MEGQEGEYEDSNLGWDEGQSMEEEGEDLRESGRFKSKVQMTRCLLSSQSLHPLTTRHYSTNLTT